MADMTDTEARKYLGTMVKFIRKSKGLSQKEFGGEFGLTQKAVSKIEKGRTSYPRSLRKMAKFGGISVAEMIEKNPFQKLTYNETVLVRVYRTLKPKNQQEIIKQISSKSNGPDVDCAREDPQQCNSCLWFTT